MLIRASDMPSIISVTFFGRGFASLGAHGHALKISSTAQPTTITTPSKTQVLSYSCHRFHFNYVPRGNQ